MSSAVEFSGVSCTLGQRRVLDSITLDVIDGEFLMLLGRSGSGKTTLLKLVNRLVSYDSGSVRIFDRDAQQWDLIPLRRSIGYAIQTVGLLPHYTVEQNIGLLLRLQNKPPADIRDRVLYLIELVGLSRSMLARYPRELSGGEQHRVGIARALAADPKLLLMDEPFGALDPVTRSQLQLEFYALAKRLNKTVLFVTHDLHEALRMGDRIAFLHDSHLLAVCPSAEFTTSDQPAIAEYVAAFAAGKQRLEA